MSKGAVPAFEGIQRDFPVGAESCGPGSSLNFFENPLSSPLLPRHLPMECCLHLTKTALIRIPRLVQIIVRVFHEREASVPVKGLDRIFGKTPVQNAFAGVVGIHDEGFAGAVEDRGVAIDIVRHGSAFGDGLFHGYLGLVPLLLQGTMIEEEANGQSVFSGPETDAGGHNQQRSGKMGDAKTQWEDLPEKGDGETESDGGSDDDIELRIGPNAIAARLQEKRDEADPNQEACELDPDIPP